MRNFLFGRLPEPLNLFETIEWMNRLDLNNWFICEPSALTLYDFNH